MQCPFQHDVCRLPLTSLNAFTFTWNDCAESQNNQVYRDARRIYKGGTPEFDLEVSSLFSLSLSSL
jgi:hypothetical protein